MPIDRKALKQPMTTSTTPPWRCPRCIHGTLEPDAKTIAKEETAWSRAATDHPDWDPEWINHRFSLLMRCNRRDCKEVVAVVGTTELHQEWDSNRGDFDYVDVFKPTFFCPPLPLFIIPEACPEIVKIRVQKAFELYWCDPSSALNSVRQAIEELLTHMKVPRLTRSRKALTLHARIQLLLQKQPEVGKLLLAAKWLGNVGSHSGATVEQDDALDAMDLLQYVIEEVVEGRTKSIEQLSRQINKAKGPTRRKRST